MSKHTQYDDDETPETEPTDEPEIVLDGDDDDGADEEEFEIETEDETGEEEEKPE